jgi:hypothetical protein
VTPQFLKKYDNLGFQIFKAWQDREYNRPDSRKGFQDADQLIKSLQKQRMELCRQFYRQTHGDVYKRLYQREKGSFGLNQLARWRSRDNDFFDQGCGWDYSSGRPKDMYLLRQFFNPNYKDNKLAYRPYRP